MSHDTIPLVWETGLKLLTRRYLWAWTVAMLATASVMTLILGTIFAAEREWDALPMMMFMIGLTTAGLWLFGMLVMAILFRGSVQVRYTVDQHGIRMDTIDRLALGVGKAATLLGVLSGKPGLAGAGLIAQSRQSEAIRWNGAFTAEADPAQLHITIRNRWRPLLYIQCTSETYAEAEMRIAAEMARHGTATRLSGRSPLPWYLGQTVLVLLACAPLLMLVDSHDIHLLPPILVLCFALATVWLINLFGWVVLAGLLFIAGNVLFELFLPRESFIRHGKSFTYFDTLGWEDAGALGLAALGAGWLAWVSIRALRGRFLSLLVRDADEADGD